MKRFLLISLFLIPAVLEARPQDITYRKTIQKDYSVSDKAQLHLGNKYGKMVLHTWDKNEISATIVVSGYGNSQDEARKLTDLVDIDASQAPGNGDVTISTSYNKPSRGFSSLWHLLFSGIKGGKGHVNIDYDVYVPKSLRMLEVEDNYGDVIADAIPTPCDMSINYCNYNLTSITGPFVLKMNYSKGTIARATSISLSAQYSTLDNEQAGAINTHSSYSNYHLSTVGTFSLHSAYDQVNIDQVDDISGESDYTYYHIGKLMKSLNLNLTYGDIKVANLAPDFHSIRLKSTYGGVYFGMDPKTQFRLDAHFSYGNLKTEGFSFKQVNNIRKGSESSFSGQTSGAGDLAPQISFEGVYSNLVLKPQ
ncbi:MAG TPA: DUF4097 family beta strand repeat-containing protein [Chitinophagaceae bacterium]|nr:DUF4097 family beta strand repeat-containing protein [Chitinophagaceae bacterium]